MSEEQSQTEPGHYGPDALNEARFIEESDIQSTPTTRKRFPGSNKKKKILMEEDESDQYWKVLLTKSVEMSFQTPLSKSNRQLQKPQKTADVKNKLSGKFQRCCPICLEDYSKIRGSLDCLHEFCFDCIQKWCESSTICPCCRKPFASILKLVREKQTGPVKQAIRVPVEKKQLVFESEYDHYLCYQCGSGDNQHVLLICDDCDFYCCHVYCDAELNSRIPLGNWYCIYCRERQRRRRGAGYFSLPAIDLTNDTLSSSQDEQSQEQNEEQKNIGISSRTRSHQYGSVANSLTLLRSLRRRA